MRAKLRPHVTLIIETSFASGRKIVRGISRYARQHGPWLFHHEWQISSGHLPEWLAKWEGDGIIARLAYGELADAVAELGVPVVDVHGAFRDAGFPLVGVDHAAIGRAAAEHLLERGFRHYAFCGIDSEEWSAIRRDAFIATVRTEGYGCRVSEWSPRRQSPWSWEEEQEALLTWLQALPKPTGLMLCNDLHSNIVLQACRRGNIAIPEKIAVVGVDDDESICTISDPPLSSVMPGDETVGYEAARLLDRLMSGGKWDGQPVRIEPLGVCTRQSTDTLAIEDANVAGALRFIREHARDGITVDDVMKNVPVCRTLMQRRFKKVLGRTLHDEILRTRLEHAKFLLSEGEMPLALIAEKSGFKHQEYMGAVFRKRLGTTPRQYRESISRTA